MDIVNIWRHDFESSNKLLLNIDTDFMFRVIIALAVPFSSLNANMLLGHALLRSTLFFGNATFFSIFIFLSEFPYI